MLSRQSSPALLIGLCLALISPTAFAQDVLDHVPQDALAFVVVRDIATVRMQLSRFTDPNAPNPIIDLFPESLINAAIGNNPGLDSRGDLLFVVRSSDRPIMESPLSVWLPVRDYESFVRALRGSPADRITVITVQGQDMLCAKLGRWALIMDATERERMDATLNGQANVPKKVADWRAVFTSNPISIGLFPGATSRRAMRDWLGDAANPDAIYKVRAPNEQDFPVRTGDANSQQKPAYLLQAEKLAWMSPLFLELLLESNALAAGVRIDDGDLHASVLMAWPEDRWQLGNTEVSAPTLHREGEFSFSGSGRFPAAISRSLTQGAARSSIKQLIEENQRTRFNPALIAEFLNECDVAAGLVRGAAVFHSPGSEEDGVYTNHFLALRVDSAEDFMAQIEATADAWNELNNKAQPTSKLVFESKRVQIVGKSAIQYSLDIVAADGLRDEPTMRQLMVRLFGPDRIMHRFAVMVDDHTVLLAAATQGQVITAFKYLKDATPSTWNATNTAIANQLVPETPAWKLFFSPAGYVKWQKRLNDATMGDVIGAPTIEPFRLTPPIAVAGSFPNGELSVELAVPSDTLRNAQAYRLQRSQRARAVQ